MERAGDHGNRVIQYRKIDENDPSYQRDREFIDRMRGRGISHYDRIVFGADLLGRIDSLGRLAEDDLERIYGTSDKDSIRENKIAESRSKLATLSDRPSYLNILLQDAPEHLGVNDDEEGVQKGFDDSRALDILDKDKISDEVYLDILKKHGDYYLELANDFMPKVPGYLRKVSEVLSGSVVGKYVNPERIESRIGDQHVIPGDLLEMVIDSRGGDYTPGLDRITVDIMDDKRMFMTLVHEVIHSIAGRTFLSEATKYRYGDDDIFEDEFLHRRRGGVGILGQERVNHFTWLNEAITAGLTEEILGITEEENRTYVEEQELVALLLSKGGSLIDHDLVLSAYFEDFDPSSPPHERIPKWKRFYQSINESYAPGFLTKLDAFVQGNGVDAAIKQMKKDWTAIMSTKSKYPIAQEAREDEAK